MISRQKVLYILIMLALLLSVGVAGFMLIEQLHFLDALYMTVITISTVGFREIGKPSPAGQIFTMVIIISGMFIAAYSVSTLASFVIEGEFKNILRSKLMDRKIEQLKEHYIVCGAGETGHFVMHQFQKSKVAYIVIDHDEAKTEQVVEHGGLVLHGDATAEDSLLKAGIMRAKGLICCLSSDSENVFAVLTARQLNPKLYIVSRAIDENAGAKLIKAGANNTVSPNEIGGARMASLVLRPAVVSFLDVIMRAGEVTFDLEEVKVGAESSINGLTLADARIPERTGMIVLAIKDRDDKMHVNPGPATLIKAGDKLVVLGQDEQLQKLRGMI